MKGLQLLSTGGALPGRVVTNEDLCRQVDTDDAWITTRTGIRQRYYCTESEDAATLAIAAARQALERSGLAPSDIACCVPKPDALRLLPRWRHPRFRCSNSVGGCLCGS